jgi:hypothetical protein
MNLIFKFLGLALSCISVTHAGMTISGNYTLKRSAAWMEITNNPSGVIQAEESKFLQLTNYGTAHLNHCAMAKEVVSFGTLLANETNFHMNLTVSSGDATLTSCTLENLIISATPSEPRVILNGSTIIRGSVEFKEASGLVYKGPDVKILGSTINGTIIDFQE